MTDYICQHCEQPAAVRSRRDGQGWTQWHAADPTDPWPPPIAERKRCYPQDPNSPTCHAIPTKPHAWLRNDANDVDCMACGLHLPDVIDEYGADYVTMDIIAEALGSPYCI